MFLFFSVDAFSRVFHVFTKNKGRSGLKGGRREERGLKGEEGFKGGGGGGRNGSRGVVVGRGQGEREEERTRETISA